MKDILINIKLIDQLKNISGCFNWNSKSISNIVPWDFNHEILISSNSIDKSITEIYFKSTRKFLVNKICSNTASDNDLEHFLYSPYPFIVEGAFFSRESLCNKLNGIIQNNYDMHLDGKKNIKTFLDLMPYFTEYAEGFRSGFFEFENDKIKPHLPMFADKEDYSHKVFEYLKPNRTWNSRAGFTLMKEENTYEICNAFKDGKHEGYYYKAWCLVFTQNRLFTPLFQKHSNTSEFKNKSNSQVKLSISQIALKNYYEGTIITRKNCKSLVEQYGHSSGESLYQKFNHYKSRANRKGIPTNCTPQILHNKIKLIESVINILSDDCKSEAIDELDILKSIAEKGDY